jgi:mRNA interferase MazF
MAKAHIPDRGDAIWLQFTPQKGHEQAGRRPALVLSPAEYNGKVGLVIVCPITGQKKGFPFEVELPSGLKVKGVVLAHQIRSIDWRERWDGHIGPVPPETVAEVVAKAISLIQADDDEE